MSKIILVFSDGTGQEGGVRNDTNIYKIFKMVEDRTSNQIAFYDRGIGTGWRKVTGNIGGMGISRNIQECYRFIFDHYEAGDQIFLFGFSRGAATVRSLSSFIHYFGILPKSRPELIAKAYKIYQISNEDQRQAGAAEFVRHHRVMWTKIKFIGCFDTVAALGLPFEPASVLLDGLPGFRHQFHNFTLSESVEHAYHALAIDDERKTFHPVLWNEAIKTEQTVKQVWFSGMHTDVGGGYKEHGLSDIPLVWMTHMAVNHGLKIYPEFNKHNGVNISENADGFMHDSRGNGITKFYRQQVRVWERRGEKPVIHESVLTRTRNESNASNPAYQPWIKELPNTTEPWVKYEDQAWRGQ